MEELRPRSAEEEINSEHIHSSISVAVQYHKQLSIIIPTYNEKHNIPILVEKLFSIFNENEIKGEVIIIDDNSPDGTGLLVEEMMERFEGLKVVHRDGKLGLSSAVLNGSNSADSDVLCVMDADLSHSPETIPVMLREIEQGADFVIGSRYIEGGKIQGWSSYRKFISKGATLLAKIFVDVKDPMSGFFMIKKECLEGVDFNAKGFKICLEFLVKAKYNNVREVPITFTNRKVGKSKASLKEYYLLLNNLFGYLRYKRTSLTQLIKFSIVGGIGTLINLSILFTLTEFLDIHYIASAVFAFIVALTNNFILDKMWTFKERLQYRTFRKYVQFSTISVLTLAVNTGFLYTFVEHFGIWYIFAQVLAIGTAFIINFLGNKLWTFRD